MKDCTGRTTVGWMRSCIEPVRRNKKLAFGKQRRVHSGESANSGGRNRGVCGGLLEFTKSAELQAGEGGRGLH